MKKLILILLFFSVYSCSTTDSNRIAPGYTEAFKTLRNAFFGYEQNIDPALIEKIPYASMLVRIGRGPQSLMILESILRGQYVWVSADGVYLVTKDGRIIRSSGLPNNLLRIESSSFSWEDIIYADQSYISYYSFLNPSLNNLKVKSSSRLAGTTIEDLVFEDKELRLIVENVVSETIGWNKENKFWVDETGFVWKSIQHISPKLPPIYIEITKRPQ